jgi:hypothetical protein
VNKKDLELGMDRSITRRDFLEGATAGAIGGAVPADTTQSTPPNWSGGPTPPTGMGPDSSAQDSMLAQGIDQNDSRCYPPDLSGMRGRPPGLVRGPAPNARPRLERGRRRKHERDLRYGDCRWRNQRVSRGAFFPPRRGSVCTCSRKTG